MMMEERHRCQRKCHNGECEPCDGLTVVECRCGGQTTEMPCSEVIAMKSQGGAEAVYTCDRRCNKKMSCSRHKCGQFCCVAADHQCRLICGCTFYFVVVCFVFIHNLVNVSSPRYSYTVQELTLR